MKTNTLIVIVLTLLIAGGVYWYFSSRDAVPEPPLSAGAAVNSAQVRFQTLLNELTPITFDTSIFSDPRFNSLVDIATNVTPEPTGRPDPFAPVPGLASSEVSTVSR